MAKHKDRDERAQSVAQSLGGVFVAVMNDEKAAPCAITALIYILFTLCGCCGLFWLASVLVAYLVTQPSIESIFIFIFIGIGILIGVVLVVSTHKILEKKRQVNSDGEEEGGI